MSQPEGFVDPAYPNHVCHLKCALYGRKQAPRAWSHRLGNFLITLGFKSCQSDTALFVRTWNQQLVYVLVYVDDIIITGSSPSMVQDLISKLGDEFAIKDGDLNFFLGIEVVKTPSGLHLSQAKYTLDILRKTNMVAAKPMPTPSSTETLPKDIGPAFEDVTQYRSVVGALQYLTLTRPDIAFLVNRVCQFMHNPTEEHWAAVKRILRYLKDTIAFGLQFQKSKSIQLSTFTDADWAGCPQDRRSTSGYCIYLGSNLISWSFKKQHIVARSSTESEYKGLANTAAELIWIQQLLQDLSITTLAPMLYCDNIGATYLVANPLFHVYTKHIEIDYHFVREQVAANRLCIRFVPSSDQVADIFTKGLSGLRFRARRDKLTVSNRPLRLRGSVTANPSNLNFQSQLNVITCGPSPTQSHKKLRDVPTSSPLKRG
ncbi:uncharacterized mitochondrial protein AtMg00810-like [Telopea speciosissima]|uniref:uncharacterized mitochondrial protein AtMg00810-like n=1 Tax=Telopea speciosissima TaxID=54955 RepID=UPI001CC71305|nr:uncharacterized mitochondrial protein AtMg00810-like [Telopea speciosissima]